jgi:hypothetical protein
VLEGDVIERVEIVAESSATLNPEFN